MAHLRLNVARTESAKSVAGRQTGRVPLQPPLQPVKRQPLRATARSVSSSPPGNVFVHLGVHLTAPLPAVVTLSGMRSGPNTAVAEAGCVVRSWHFSKTPEQAPAHRTKRELLAEVAVKIIV